ncbi:MAG TPA: hypothetical protein O0X50_01785 [Methanocorpusculum sp.]|nr:hypothetical protein [Methanocorpusculum sp.]
MAELNFPVTEELKDSKLSGYGWNSNNFVIDDDGSRELTILITLNEYRKLVQDCATAEFRIKAASDNKYDLEKKVASVLEENSRLKEENYDLKRKLDDYCSPVVRDEEDTANA